jgi:3-dehydroquinate synthase
LKEIEEIKTLTSINWFDMMKPQFAPTAALAAVVASCLLLLLPSAFAFHVGGTSSSSSSSGGGGIINSSTSRRQMTATNEASATDTKNYDIVKVDLTDGRDYPIYIGTSYTDEQITEMLTSHIGGKQVLIITNDRIAPMGYLDKYEKLLAPHRDVHTLVLPDGESKKTLETLELILNKALEEKLDRKCTFIALGGGVIGDMVGFASAVYQRGVDFIQIPTTVMAMTDSSVGGKTGVNHPLGKNMVGAFHQPQCVFIDTDSLNTLPDRELQSGIAEVIKYGLIKDKELFEWLEDNMEKILERDPGATRYAVKRSCENKAEVVKADEKEAGVRATLNLGHTFGHAIESGSGYGTWLHGEAVAIGTAMATTMSAEMGWIEVDLVERTYKLLEKAKLPVDLPLDSPMNRETFLNYMAADKKVANGQLRLILLKGPLGNCVFTGDFDDKAMVNTIDEFVAECAGAQ